MVASHFRSWGTLPCTSATCCRSPSAWVKLNWPATTPATISARDSTSGPVPRPRRSTSSTAVAGRITAARVISQMPPSGASPASGVSISA